MYFFSERPTPSRQLSGRLHSKKSQAHIIQMN